jgi:hypothetical protein
LNFPSNPSKSRRNFGVSPVATVENSLGCSPYPSNDPIVVTIPIPSLQRKQWGNKLASTRPQARNSKMNRFPRVVSQRGTSFDTSTTCRLGKLG